MKKNRILWGVSGGISLYKSLDIIHGLKKEGYKVQVVMTKNATKLVSPRVFEVVSGNEVVTDTFAKPMFHIDVVGKTDLFILAPATYNIIGKLANGIADDCLTSVASALETQKKLIAPAMNSNMYKNPILEKNLEILKSNRYEILKPEYGILACGYEGVGRMREGSYIGEYVRKRMGGDGSIKEVEGELLPKGLSYLRGKKVVITAGGTIERIDPVRYICNRSSGKMGICLSGVCVSAGSEVKLIYSNINVSLPKGAETIYVESAKEMEDVLRAELKDADILIMSAAVCDYRVKEVLEEKLKRGVGGVGKGLNLELVENDDILQKLLSIKKSGQKYIGFAAESDDLVINGRKKLERKGLDLILCNDIKRDDIGFGSDFNEVVLLGEGGYEKIFSRMKKEDLSVEILREVGRLFYPSE